MAVIGPIPTGQSRSEAGSIAPRRLSSEVSAKAALPVVRGGSTVSVSFDDISRRALAIVVEEQRQEGAGRIACGHVGGGIVEDEVVFGLAEQDGSGYVGIGRLRTLGDRTEVAVYLMAAPSSSSAPAVEVTIDDAAFSPPALTVPVGATVVWSNEGTIAHAVTGSDLAFADSAVLDPGQTFAQRFDAPGTYAYHCDPHPSMTGTVTVQ